MKRSFEVTAGIAAGIAAPLVYAAAVIVGAWFTPGYSHLRQTISELTAAGAPTAGSLGDVFLAYNLLLACFAIALPAALPELPQRAIRLAAAALIATAAAGFAMSVFPLAGPPPSGATLPHVTLAAVASLATMASILAVAVAAWRSPQWRWLALASIVCLAIVAAAGAWAAFAVGGAIAGLAERVTIGAFMAWLLLLATALALAPHRRQPAP